MYPLDQGVQLTRAPGRGAWGVSFSLCFERVKDSPWPNHCYPSSLTTIL
jgi:hypothetical protein